jgi:hypothetical protein
MLLLPGIYGMLPDVGGEDHKAGDTRVDFVVYSVQEVGGLTWLSVHGYSHYFNIFEFIDENIDVEYDEERIGKPISSSMAQVHIRTSTYDGNRWGVANVSGLRIYIVKDIESGPEDCYVMSDGMRMDWTQEGTVNGTADLEIQHPDIIDGYQYIVEVDLGEGDGWERVEGHNAPFTMEAPLKRMDYVIYNIRREGSGAILEIFNHSGTDVNLAIHDVERIAGMEFEIVRTRATVVRNRTVTIAYKSWVRDLTYEEEWIPNANGTVWCHILRGHNAYFDANRIFETYEDDADGEGRGTIEVTFPGELAQFQFMFTISMGWSEPTPTPNYNSEWNFTVHPPQSIEITNVWKSPDEVRPGDLMTVSGYVKFIYTGTGVRGADITISGDYISTRTGLTDIEGRFVIMMQAPILVADDHTLHIEAVDGYSWETANTSLTFPVEGDPEDLNPPDGDPPIPGPSFPAVTLSIVIGAVVIGALRRRTIGPQSR